MDYNIPHEIPISKTNEDYFLKLELPNSNDRNIYISLFECNDSENVLCSLELCALWEPDEKSLTYLNESNKEKEKRLTIQKEFNKGDYYQQNMFKESKDPNFKHISFGAIIHDIIIKYSHLLMFMKNIYSSTLAVPTKKLNSEQIYYDAIHFWILQLENPNINVEYVKKHRRFRLSINN